MRVFTILLISVFTQLSVFANSFNALVIEFTADLRTTMPDDGWVKLSFNVVNYGEKKLNAKFKAVCLESGLELPFHPQNDKLTFAPDDGMNITVFLNSQCGLFEEMTPGKNIRTIQYSFVNPDTKETMTFSQQYIIEIPRKGKHGR